MAIRLVEPASINPTQQDWNNLQNKLINTSIGIQRVAFSGVGTSNLKILAGSRFSVTNQFYEVIEDEPIDWSDNWDGTTSIMGIGVSLSNNNTATVSIYLFDLANLFQQLTYNVNYGALYSAGNIRLLALISKDISDNHTLYLLDSLNSFDNKYISGKWYVPTPRMPENAYNI